MARLGGRGFGFCILYIVIGAILGGILGELLKGVGVLSGIMPYLVTAYPVFDISPFTINLYVIRLTIGLGFAPNLVSILGVVLALFLFRKYS